MMLFFAKIMLHFLDVYKRQLLIRLPAAWLLAWPMGLGLPGLYLAQAISPVLPALVGTIYFKSSAWERKRPASPIDEYYDIF